MGHNGNLRAGEDDPTGVSGSGTGAAALLVGAVIGGVGGVLPGDETHAAEQEAPKQGADEDAKGQQPS